MKSKIIVLTGGGTAGHVMVNLALLPSLKKNNWEPIYIGSHTGIEKKLIEGKIPFHGISSGKLRRYFDLKNFSDSFRVLAGVMQSFILLRKISPGIIFSKGGYVSVPVVVAGWLLKIPVIAHEADITPGLANRISFPFVKHICLAFEESGKHIKQKKFSVTGIPIRNEILRGSKEAGLKYTRFDNSKPILLVMGGSSGSQKINQFIRSIITDLLEIYQVVHICGAGNLQDELTVKGYYQSEYIRDELPDIYAVTDLAISRAGANSLFELLALNIPHILIPLSLSSSRGDQIENAKSFQKSGYSEVMFEEKLSKDDFFTKLAHIRNSELQIKQKMADSPLLHNSDNILNILENSIAPLL